METSLFCLEKSAQDHTSTGSGNFFIFLNLDSFWSYWARNAGIGPLYNAVTGTGAHKYKENFRESQIY